MLALSWPALISTGLWFGLVVLDRMLKSALLGETERLAVLIMFAGAVVGITMAAFFRKNIRYLFLHFLKRQL
jgi:hypothetical protein